MGTWDLHLGCESESFIFHLVIEKIHAISRHSATLLLNCSPSDSSGDQCCICLPGRAMKASILRREPDRFLFQSRRSISLHEYQSKKILNENNLNVQRFQVVDNPQDAKRAGEELS